MPADRLQRQRFEIKYRIAATLVEPLREFIRCHLEPDPFSSFRPDLSYPVYSIYLDSPDLSLCRATINSDCNRYKLRLRAYSGAADAPVFLEVKRRRNDAILKQRAAVRRCFVSRLLAGEPPRLEHLASPDERQLDALTSFLFRAHSIDAAPKAFVHYHREAWMSHSHNAVRITFDRDVRCEPWATSDFGGDHASAVSVFGDIVIFEVKFTDRFPRWIGEMVETFNLTRTGAAKYVDGLSRAEAAGLAAADPAMAARAFAL